MKVGYQIVIENAENPLTQSVGEVLGQGLKLIEKIDDASFTKGIAAVSERIFGIVSILLPISCRA